MFNFHDWFHGASIPENLDPTASCESDLLASPQGDPQAFNALSNEFQAAAKAVSDARIKVEECQHDYDLAQCGLENGNPDNLTWWKMASQSYANLDVAKHELADAQERLRSATAELLSGESTEKTAQETSTFGEENVWQRFLNSLTNASQSADDGK